MTRRDLFAALQSPLGWRCGLVLAALAVVIFELSMPSSLPDAPTVGKLGVPESSSAALPSSIGNYGAIGESPLFMASRKPWAPPPPVPVVPPAISPSPPRLSSRPPPSGYALVGMVLSGETRRALIRPSNGPTVMLSEGDAIEGWKLQKIQDGVVHFVADGESFDLAFSKLSPTNQPSQAAHR